MKFKFYLALLNKLAKDHPESLEYDVVYGQDDEGNSFGEVVYAPTIGEATGMDHKEFSNTTETPNAVCLN